jgi:hypothetical protein
MPLQAFDQHSLLEANARVIVQVVRLVEKSATSRVPFFTISRNSLLRVSRCLGICTYLS